MEKQIKDYPNYTISSEGIVTAKAINRVSLGRNCLYKEKNIKPQLLKNGYLSIRLHNDKGGKTFYVHRLVAETFLNNTDNKKTVNHKDGDKLNNNVKNLEWSTYSENIKHAFKNGLKKFTEYHLKRIKESGLCRAAGIYDEQFNVCYLSYKCAAKELNYSESYMRKLIRLKSRFKSIRKNDME